MLYEEWLHETGIVISLERDTDTNFNCVKDCRVEDRPASFTAQKDKSVSSGIVFQLKIGRNSVMTKDA